MTFDEVKATQTAASLLRLAGGRLQYLALIKMLYMLDREALKRWGFPVTTDHYVSMKLGPVTSEIYDLVKVKGEPAHPSFWSSHIRREDYDAVLTADPSDSELSPAEDDLIAEVFALCSGKDGFQLADQTHKNFPEWTDPGNSSFPIDVGDILAVLGKDEAEVAQTGTMMSIQNALLDMTRASR
jgi:uncharacterized phage-associated protein